MQVMRMMEYLNCKVFYVTFTLKNILGQVFPDLLKQIILLYMEIMICLIFKCLLVAVVWLESILFSLAFLFVFICVYACACSCMKRQGKCMIKANIWKGCFGALKPVCIGISYTYNTDFFFTLVKNW